MSKSNIFPQTIRTFINSVNSLKLMNEIPEELVESPRFELFTEKKILASFLSKKASIYHKLLLNNQRTWNCRLVAALLNELDYVIFNSNSYNKKEDYYLFSFKSTTSKDILLHIHILNNGEIDIFIHRSMLALRGDPIDFVENRSIDAQGRVLTQPKKYAIRQYSMYIDIVNGSTIALINSLSMMFYQKSSFLPSCHIFIKKFLELKFSALQKQVDLEPLQNYSSHCIGVKKKTCNVNSLESFMSSVDGYLHLNLIKNKYSRSFQNIVIDGVEYSILNGIYISPFTHSLFNENPELIDGILMDTTWRAISKYVTSILMCSSYNVGVPTAFAFSSAEDKELYSLLINHMRDDVGVDLTTYYVESDQGSALKAVCDEFKKTHFACLRHFKVSLKCKVFSFQLGKLLSCSSQIEFDSLRRLYSSALCFIDDHDTLKQIQSTLFKAGLCFDSKEIIIVDDKKWEKVSMLKRIEARMPSTTNSLESTHGHINATIPRHNAFWQSLFRLVKAIISKDFRYNQLMKNTYCTIKRNVKYRAKVVDSDVMKDEIKKFNTTLETCLCGETRHAATLLRIDIPCSHRYTLGAKFEDLPEVTLVLNKEISECKFTYTIINLTKESPPSSEHITLKNQVVKTIKRYSHYKKKS